MSDIYSQRELVTQIVGGEYVLSDKFQIQNYILNRSAFRLQLNSCGSDMHKMEMISNVFPKLQFKEYMDKNCNVLKKNDMMTKLFKDKGDEHFKKANMNLALRCFNLALSFATTNNKDMGVLYLDRSVLLLEMEEYEECLKDIELLLANKWMEDYITTMRGLKLRCMALQSDKAPKGNEEEQTTRIKDYCENFLFQISGNKNSIIPSAAEIVEIVCDEEKGRRVIVTKDLDPGVTVIVEDPYMSVLNNICTWDMKHCSHCLKSICRTIPCPNCVFMVYCDEKCLNEDFKNGHKYECPCMVFMHSNRVEPHIQLSFKMICKAGPEILFKFYQNLKPKNPVENICNIKGFDQDTGIYNSNSYYQINHLMVHDFKDGLPSINLVCKAMLFAQTLDYNTHFFDGYEGNEKTGFLFYVATKILFHFNSIPFNAFGISEDIKIAIGYKKKVEIKHISMSTGIYSLISILNHSCDPNVTRINASNGKIAIFTNRKLKKGDELLMSYGFSFKMQEFRSRQQQIEQIYRFKCECPACKFDWPTHKEMKSSLDIICPKYEHSFDHLEPDETKKCILIPSSTGDSCKNCGNDFKLLSLKEEPRMALEKLNKAESYVKDKKLLEAIPLLKECIIYYQTKVLLPNINFLSAQELLHQCYLMITKIS